MFCAHKIGGDEYVISHVCNINININYLLQKVVILVYDLPLIACSIVRSSSRKPVNAAWETVISHDVSEFKKNK